MARKKGRNVDGILLLDKPSGLTSNAALRRVSRFLDARKAGHTGSLDPLATGLLVLCFGEATKVSGWLLDADKSYTCLARLGVTTDSADADGQILQRRQVPAVDDEALEDVLSGFRGQQAQVPPMFSALKHDGQRLHELARQGIEVERPPRQVCIHDLNATRVAPDALRLEVTCSKGTYIRSLVADIGEQLGCGAHVEQLRRTGLGPFKGPSMWSLETLERLSGQGAAALDGCLLPTDTALADYPAVTLAASAAERFCHGQAVSADRPAEAASILTVYGPDAAFLGIGAWRDDGAIAPRRLLVQRTARG